MSLPQAGAQNRALFRLKTYFKLRYYLAGGPFIAARSNDISGGGMLMESAEAVQEGAFVAVEIRFPGTWNRIHARAKVLRSYQKDGKNMAALQFQQPAASFVEAVTKFIDRQSNFYLDQLALLIFAFLASAVVGVRLACVAVIGWFSGTTFGSEWVLSCFASGSDKSIYILESVFLAGGFLVFSVMIYLYQTWARYPLALFYAAGLGWQIFRLWRNFDGWRWDFPSIALFLFDLIFAAVHSIFLAYILGPAFRERFNTVLSLRNLADEEKLRRKTHA